MSDKKRQGEYNNHLLAELINVSRRRMPTIELLVFLYVGAFVTSNALSPFTGPLMVYGAIHLADSLTIYSLDCWETGNLYTLGDAAEVVPRHGLQHPNYLLGDIVTFFGPLLVLLDRDRWICTADLDTFAETLQVKRHFFIFPEWVNLCGEVIFVATPTQDLVIASRRNITVFRGWLEISETIPIGYVDIDAEFERYQKDEFWTPNQHLR